MGWRFRKSFRVIPGVRLNLSKSGLSASIGGAPITLNMGQHGMMGTISIPGTGISYRQHFSNSPSSTPHSIPSVSPNSLPAPLSSFEPTLPIPVSSAPVQEIRSASTELLTSESLKELKRLIQTTHEQREEISRELGTARAESVQLSGKTRRWENGFLFKRLFKDAFAKLKVDTETAAAKVQELEEQLRLTTVATQVEMAREQAEPYFRMRDEFAAVSGCSAIWDVKSEQATNKFRERTTADKMLARERVTFSLDSSDLIQWEQKVPHLRNTKGGDIYLYPGFILYRAAREAFSVISFHDVKIAGAHLKFQEDGTIPSDSKVIGQTWAKANKDGGPDRRFAQNHPIPIVLYGELSLKSESGLWEEFELSTPEPLDRFLKAWAAFVTSFEPPKAVASKTQESITIQ